MKEVIQININEIIPNKYQPRLDFYDETIEGLAESIKENGLLQPVTVRKTDNGKYELIAGERRYRACKFNGNEKIEAIVLEKSDDESAKLALIENLQREELNAIEQAFAMRHIMASEDLTQQQLASRLGYKQSTVANKLRLLKLPKYIQESIAHGDITERHARALLNVPEEMLENVYLTVTNRKYNVSKTEEYIKSLLSGNTHRKGVSNNVRIGMNTIQQAFDLCKKSGIDSDIKMTEYEDEVKIVIRMKK